MLSRCLIDQAGTMADSDQLPTRVASVLEDPGARTIARTYAGALVGAAERVGVESALEEFQSFLDDVLDKHLGFHALLVSGIVNRDHKLTVIDRVIAPHASELFANFLRVLVRHDRIDLLPLILGQAWGLHEQSVGRRRVHVTSARQLSDEARQQIFDRLNEKLPFEPVIEEHVAPSVLGGLVIQVGDTVHDSSLLTRVKQLRAGLRERSLHEIQSGRNRFSHSTGN